MARRILLGVLAVVFVLGVWIAVDLNDHSRHTLREFDPHEVARLETRMWRSYYEHRRLRLFADLVTLLREQYHLPVWQAYLGAYHAARAAVVFQRGGELADYRLALPDLIHYYSLIDAASIEPLRVPEVSDAELEWWIVHRQRAQHQPGDLAHALAVLQAGIFHQPLEDFAEHAGVRAEAMDLCDAGNAHGGASEAEWAKIQGVLDRSWSALHTVVNR
jgi:hypothetical protein